MLTIHQLNKRFDHLQAVKDFNLVMQPGEFVTLLGPSGSGKTTVLRMVAGLESPTSGSIHLGDVDVTHLTPQKRNIGLVFQSYALFPNMSAYENIAFPLHVRKQDKHTIQKRVNELLALIGLTNRKDHLPHQLSGGERQRVALARALSFHPPLLLLDEPLSALDAKVRQSLRITLKEIQRTLGVTTLMVTHDQEEALELSDRIVVMAKGAVEQVGTAMDIYYAPQTAFTEGFIGETNPITAEVLDVIASPIGEKIYNLRWHHHVFSWLADRHIEPQGTSITIGIRPESFHFLPVGGHGSIEATIVDKLFFGSVTRFIVKLPDHTTVKVDAMSAISQQYPIGAKVGLLITDPRLPIGFVDEAVTMTANPS
nr:ABC transporter ATP-binding protein [Bacilli bacterium]